MPTLHTGLSILTIGIGLISNVITVVVNLNPAGRGVGQRSRQVARNNDYTVRGDAYLVAAVDAGGGRRGHMLGIAFEAVFNRLDVKRVLLLTGHHGLKDNGVINDIIFMNQSVF